MDPDINTYQDDCLLKMEVGKAPPLKSLCELPPWRAVLIARVAERAKLLTRQEVGFLEDEARRVTGSGSFKHITRYPDFNTDKIQHNRR